MGKINSFYKSTIEEASVDSYGYNFLCVYGSHINNILEEQEKEDIDI